MLKLIEQPNDYLVCEFDGIGFTSVYTGSFSNLKNVNDKLTWREDEEAGEMCYQPCKILTLSEITQQVANLYGHKNVPIITIFIEDPLSGQVLQYGNYGDSWWRIGDLSGYA